MSYKPKAVALISGGLDSMLAARMMLEQGIEVVGLNFYTGFCHSGHTSAIRSSDKRKEAKRNDALWVANQLGIKLEIVDIVEEYKAILTKPRYGYGVHLNPCLDCKIFMVSKAFEWMHENNFDFIITGEVMGQRLKSQKKKMMEIVSEKSSAEERLLRPLCAKKLPPTYPEQQGWIDREKLGDFSGRSRKPQIALAKAYGFDEYAQPSGGCCVLTDKSYCKKLGDMWQSRNTRNYELDDIIMLKVGRHIRFAPHCKLIISRDEGETNFLEGHRKRYNHFRIKSHPGPLVLVDGEFQEDDLQQAAAIAARFSAGRDAEQVDVEYFPIQGESHLIQVKPTPTEAIKKEWYI